MRIKLLVTLCFLLLAGSCNSEQKKLALASESEATLQKKIKIFIDYCWNKADSTQLNAIADENFVRYLNGIKVAATKKEMQAHMEVYFTGFPDLLIQIDTVYIDDNNVFMRWTSTGTNTGVYGEIEATGKKVKFNGLSHLYFNEEGKLYREDVVYNELELLQQLGYSLVAPVME